MNIGMLWYDNDPKTELVSKIEIAAGYYRRKYGATPNLCFVHPTSEGVAPDGIELRHSRQILKNHLWIGVERNEINPE